MNGCYFPGRNEPAIAMYEFLGKRRPARFCRVDLAGQTMDINLVLPELFLLLKRDFRR